MTSRELTLAVAAATGECAHTIRDRGFSELDLRPVDPDAGRPLLLCCPACGADVPLTDRGVGELPELAECRRCDAAYPYRHDEIFTADERRQMELAACA